MKSGHPGLARPSMFDTRISSLSWCQCRLFLVIFVSWKFRIFDFHDFSQISAERRYVRRFSTLVHSCFVKFIDGWRPDVFEHHLHKQLTFLCNLDFGMGFGIPSFLRFCTGS